jgi:hypothetical protein
VFYRFSRGEYLFPELQPVSHRGFKTEQKVLQTVFPASVNCVLSASAAHDNEDNSKWHFCAGDCSLMFSALSLGHQAAAADSASSFSSPSSFSSSASSASSSASSASSSCDDGTKEEKKCLQQEVMSSPSTSPLSPPDSSRSIPASRMQPASDLEMTLEMIMFDVNQERMESFRMGTYDATQWRSCKSECGTVDGACATARSGIDTIFEDAAIQAQLFDPCGYSCNGLVGEQGHYFTIHITPEADFSFVSFETNVPREDYSALIDRVLHLFKPKRCTIALFGGSPHVLLSKDTMESRFEDLFTQKEQTQCSRTANEVSAAVMALLPGDMECYSRGVCGTMNLGQRMGLATAEYTFLADKEESWEAMIAAQVSKSSVNSSSASGYSTTFSTAESSTEVSGKAESAVLGQMRTLSPAFVPLQLGHRSPSLQAMEGAHAVAMEELVV